MGHFGEIFHKRSDAEHITVYTWFPTNAFFSEILMPNGVFETY